MMIIGIVERHKKRSNRNLPITYNEESRRFWRCLNRWNPLFVVACCCFLLRCNCCFEWEKKTPRCCQSDGESLAFTLISLYGLWSCPPGRVRRKSAPSPPNKALICSLSILPWSCPLLAAYAFVASCIRSSSPSFSPEGCRANQRPVTKLSPLRRGDILFSHTTILHPKIHF